MDARTAEDIRGAAIGYAGRGWPVIPLWWPRPDGACACGRPDCSKPGKHPLVRRGFHAATAEPALIRWWWSRWPLANVGIRTGAASGLLVVDVDGEAGRESLRALSREYGPVRAAWARSGSGGWHAYMRLSDGQHAPSSVGRLGPGLDTRADGGSIVAPPSRHASGGLYRWLRPGVEPPAAPEWLVRLAQPPPLPPARPVRLSDLRSLDRYAAAAVRGEADEVARTQVGARNQRLYVAALRLGRLVAGGVVNDAVAREALLAAAAVCGLPHHESVGTVRSGMSAGRRNPRQPTADGAAPAPPVVLHGRSPAP